MRSGGFKKKKTKSGSRSTTRPKRKTITTKRKSAKVKRRTTIRKPMVRRRSRTRSVRRRSSRAFGGIGSSLKTGVIGDVVKGIGAGSLVSLVIRLGLVVDLEPDFVFFFLKPPLLIILANFLLAANCFLVASY